MERMRRESVLDLQALREELAVAERELEEKEAAPIEGRVADEALYMISLRQLQRRVDELRAEVGRLSADEEW
jgi:uncharacterized small protein (DUF1192 family)